MNRKIMLNGAWEMRPADEEQWIPATVPGSVYADLLDVGRMEDPFWRDNEQKAFDLMEKDYVYRRTFDLTEADLSCDALLLTCEGLDTAATVAVNGQELLFADNMHRTWTVDVMDFVAEGENLIEITFESPNRTVKERYAQCRVEGSSDATVGFPLLRKAHCMFGWDWGPRLPDAGVWRDIYLTAVTSARLTGVRVHQEHEDGRVTLSFETEVESHTGLCECTEPEYSVRYTLTAPDGETLQSVDEDIVVEKPELWWPNGYGRQPLYTVRAELMNEDGDVLDVWEKRIGLRTMTMRRAKDQWGETFET